MNRRAALRTMGAAAVSAISRSRFATAKPAQNTRPNIILIVIDDLRWDEFGAGGHPYLKTPSIDRLAREGAVFSRAFHAVPLCSPNRACILTGQYVARHSVFNNADRSRLSHLLPTFPQELQRSGYVTGHVGKWHMGNDPTPRPGFTYWLSFPGQGKIIDPELFENGRLQKVSGYVTDLLTDRALGFVRQQRGAQRPFFLYLAHKAVHPDAIQRNDGSIDVAYGNHYIAAERHAGRYKDKTFPRDKIAKSPMQATLGSKMVSRFLQRKGSEEIVREFGATLDPGTSEQSIRTRAEMVLSIDEGLGHLFSELEESRQLDNTVIMFTSDNGYFFGEHGLSVERRLPYEESIRAPLIVRYSPVVAPRTIHELVSSVDVAPTLLDFGGAKIGEHIQGRSYLPLLRTTRPRAPWRSSVLIENFSDDQPFPWLLDADYKAIRTERHKLIQWIQHPEFDELYDLMADPREERNLIADPGQRNLVRQLKSELVKLVQHSISLQ